jgi:hypothetical protein
MFATAESIVRRGEWDADQIRWMGLGQGIIGQDGHLYIRKGIGVSLLALPLVWLGMIAPFWGAATTTLIFNALVTAATGVLVLRYMQILGYADGVALVAGLIFGLATPAWPYAKTFFSDPLAGLCLVAAALALLLFRRSGHFTSTLLAGLALAVAVAARYANAVLIPLYALLLFKYQASNRNLQTSRHKSLLASLISQDWRAWIAFGAPLAVSAISLAYYNFARYGDPLNTGYLPEESFNAVWWQGIAGMLVSPGRGLILYAPVLLISLAAAPAFFRQHRTEAALAWAVIIVHVLLYGKWFMWHGGYAWGPRFMVPTLSFFVIAMAPAIERAKEPGWWRRSLLVLAGFSLLIQILGLSINFERFQTRLLDTGLPLFAPVTFFDPRYSPLIGQFQFLRAEYLDFVWISEGQVDWPLLAGLTMPVLFSGWWLWKAHRLRSRPSTNLPISHSSVFPALLILVVTVWLLMRAHALQPSDLRDAAAALSAQTTTADVVITGTPEESVAFSDLYAGRADVLGLSAGAPFDGYTADVLAGTVAKHPRVWWLPNWLPSEDIQIERWLLDHGFRVQERTFSGQRLALFYFPPQPLVEFDVGTSFGDSIVLERTAIAATARPGGVLPVALHWAARQPVPDDYHVFVHLLDAEEVRIAQSDNQPALWTRPTSSWAPGELIQDRHALALPSDLPPDVYTLIAGVYLPETGERLLTEGDEEFIILGNAQIRE